MSRLALGSWQEEVLSAVVVVQARAQQPVVSSPEQRPSAHVAVRLPPARDSVPLEDWTAAFFLESAGGSARFAVATGAASAELTPVMDFPPELAEAVECVARRKRVMSKSLAFRGVS